MTKNKLGERLKERREELMMTQKDIADNIGVAVSTIQRYESGKIKDIKLPVIDAIAKFLRVQPEWLMGYEEPEYKVAFEMRPLQIGEPKGFCFSRHKKTPDRGGG